VGIGIVSYEYFNLVVELETRFDKGHDAWIPYTIVSVYYYTLTSWT
jgi:hypothetical protein